MTPLDHQPPIGANPDQNWTEAHNMRATTPPRRSRRRAALATASVLLAAVLASASPIASPVADAQVTPGCVVDLTGMLGWWRGEETVTAEVGPDLAGTTAFDGGIVGQAMVFDPDSDFSTSVAATNLAPVADGLTVEMWVKPTDQGFTGLT